MRGNRPLWRLTKPWVSNVDLYLLSPTWGILTISIMAAVSEPTEVASVTEVLEVADPGQQAGFSESDSVTEGSDLEQQSVFPPDSHLADADPGQQAGDSFPSAVFEVLLPGQPSQEEVLEATRSASADSACFKVMQQGGTDPSSPSRPPSRAKLARRF